MNKAGKITDGKVSGGTGAFRKATGTFTATAIKRHQDGGQNHLPELSGAG